MKLRNKKTGEIKNVNHNKVLIHFNDGQTECINSLAELNEEWEDVGTFWFLNGCGDVCKDEDDKHKEEALENAKQIGNYFNTKEEAEKAVGKLKAWKRLRNNGLKITGYGKYAYDPKSTHHIDIALDYVSDEDRKDLDLLFGGEE